jgi:hypothetical protein
VLNTILAGQPSSGLTLALKSVQYARETSAPRRAITMSEHNTLQSWWTEDRMIMWRQIDEATKEVSSLYEPDGRLFDGLSLHVSAPNPDGINADISPDAWYVTVPYEERRVDVQTIASLLSDELDAPITLRPRPGNWEPGYWLIIQDGEQSLQSGGDRSDD